MKRLVLLGGGHGHVEVLRSLAANPIADVSVTLVTPSSRLVYTAMVPGVIAGHYALAESAIDVGALARAARVTLVLATASRVKPGEHEVLCADGTAIGYDALSIDVGSCPVYGDAAGVKQHAVPMRPLEGLVRGWVDVRARAHLGKVSSITLVGGGAAGVELALAMDHGLRREMKGDAPHVRVITDAPLPLPGFPPEARARLRKHLARRNIGMHVSSPVKEVGDGYVRLQGGIEFASDATFWATGAGAPDWIAASGFAADSEGFLLTNDFLQSVTYRDVFAIGDCSTQEHRPVAKAAVFAVRAAPVLDANLRAFFAGTPLRRHAVDPRYLALVSTGPRHAVAVWGGLSWQGGWVWRWKDAIDRRFVERYRVAPGAAPVAKRQLD